ncbi:hypothetical protein BGZ72_005821 [Mortierella alpina]|nr:hypothetical protein BGZ72_005821 [Mortierella alpina]
MSDIVRSRLGLDLKLRTLFVAPTIAQLAQKLVQGGAGEDDEYSVIFPIKTSGTRPPLFCVHTAAGLSWSYSGLIKYLHPEQPVYGIQARGLDGKSKLATSVEQMTQDYIEQIRLIQPHGPYHLLGWSFGGTVVHSMAAELEEQGEKVPLLVMMDTTARYSINNRFGELASNDDMAMDAMKFDQSFLRTLGAASVEDALPMMKRVMPVSQNILGFVTRFKPSVYSGDILFFWATVEHEFVPAVDPYSWTPYVRGAIEVHNVECSHTEMDGPAPMAVIGQVVASELEKLRRGTRIEM